ncbi:hypothetical protein AR457_37695 [Streptomyces agglomeratus]|uniref:hypothetical protein n=1 Tax=Streptomyces agglomeratus TaxID=285458 RepID=UPI000854D0E2|nr:hypothetical protein [Streptomyces agglomeratus]OEJ22948.1 hypothetical protein AR457_37695 [Streptomyces agglomeratus]
MEQSDGLPTGFSPDEYDRVAQAARGVGKSPEAFVRDAALHAAEDPFLDALAHARESVTRLAPVFAEHSEEPRSSAAPGASFPDAAPLGSRDLGQTQQSHAA